MLFEFLIDVQHLTNRRVKPGQQLTAHNENINLTVAKFVLHGFFVSVSIAILFHHLFPVFDNLMIGAFIDVIHTFPHIRGRNGNRTIQVTKLLKAFQIANGIPLIVGSQHGLEACILEAKDKMIVDIQRNTLDSGICGS